MELGSRNKSAGGLGGTVGGEEVDFASDLRLARRLKRRSIGSGNFGINARREKRLMKTIYCSNGNNDALVETVIVDSDDEKLLDVMELDADFDVGVCVDNADGNEHGSDFSDVFDPQYMMFLANLKEDGKSYLLELASGIETPLVLKYEKEDDGSNSEIDVDNLDTLKCHKKQGIVRTEDALKSQSKKEKPLKLTSRSNSGRENTENSKRVLRSDLGRERSESPRRLLRSKSLRKNNKSPSIMHDVAKKVKPEIRRVLRSNSRRENNRSSTKCDGYSSKMHNPKASNAARHQCNHVVDSDDLMDESYQEFLKLTNDGPHLVWRPEGGKTVVYEKSDSETEAEEEAEGLVSSAECGCPRKRQIPKAANAKPQFNHGAKSNLVDESNQEFLKSLKDGQHCDSETEAEEEAEDPVSPARNGSPNKRHNPKASDYAKHQCNHGAKSDLVDESHSESLKFVKEGRHQSKREKSEHLKLTPRSNSGRKNTENSKRILGSNLGRERSESPRRLLRSKSLRKNNKNPSIMHDVVKKVKPEIPRVLRSNSRIENNRSSTNGYGCSSKMYSPRANNAARHQCNRGVDYDDLMDESYQEFLKLMKVGPHLVWRPKGGKTVVYEKSDSGTEAEEEVEGPVSSAEYGCPGKRHIPKAANAKLQFNHGAKNSLVDESYQEFLKSLKDGQHCDSETEAEEEAEDPVSPAKNGSPSKRHNPKASDSTEYQCNNGAQSGLVDESHSEFLKFAKEGLYLECAPEGGKKVIYEESDCDSEAGKKAEDPVPSENSCSSKSQIPEATSSARHQCNHGVKSEVVDESYQEFLKFVMNGQHLEYTPEGGRKVPYEESDADSEVMILDNNPFSDGKPTSVVFIDLDGEECIENHGGSKGSVFRLELMEILQKPYDILEYEKLWQDASHRSPLQGVRILRSQNKSYPLDSTGKSYLDVHSDLASVINQARPDKSRILNLLRGFFYWLLNLAREGSFKPWLDSSCLRTVPSVPL